MRHGRNAAPSALVLLNKRAGLTSFESLGEIKRILGTGRVGHTGTLDKFARGLLLVLSGSALKLSPWFSSRDKRYEALVRFGLETDTLDPEGETIARAPPPSCEAVEAVLPRFSGEIMQAPPEYSAVHINGKRASALARAGETPEMKQRPVRIFRLELRSWEPPFAKMAVHCSSGTYIRSLARDIARAAGSRAHLASLVRTQIAGFRLEEAAGVPLPITKQVIGALGLPWFEVEAGDVQRIRWGRPLDPILEHAQPVFSRHGSPPEQAAGVFCGDSFIAMIEKTGETWRYGYVYAGT
jgi:tRNA pseudouridine55 synthase